MVHEPKYPVNTVIKAIEIINYLCYDTGGNQGASISELSNKLGMSKSTVHRLLDTLQFYDYVEQNHETSRYRLGWELYKIGSVIPMQNQLFNLDKSILIDLSDKIGEVVNLGVLKKRETIILTKIDGARDGKFLDIFANEYESIHATALGKVMISERREDEVRFLLDDEESLPVYTANTISNVTALLRDLERVREQGYAVDAEEFCIGLYCIAMPIRDYSEKIIGAVSVSTPTVRMDKEKKLTILEALRAVTKEISGKLGYRK